MRGKRKKIYLLFVMLVTAMLLSGFSVVGPSSRTSGQETDAANEELDTDAANGELEGTLDFSDWKEVTDGRGGLVLKVPATAQQVSGTEKDDSIYCKFLDADGNEIGTVKAAAYIRVLPSSLRQYTNARPRSGGGYLYKYDNVTADSISWAVWFGSPYGADGKPLGEYHLIANGNFAGGENGFLEIDLQAETAAVTQDEVYEMARTVLESAYCAVPISASTPDFQLEENFSVSGWKGMLPIAIAAVSLLLLLVVFFLFVLPVLKRKQFGAGAAAGKVSQKGNTEAGSAKAEGAKFGEVKKQGKETPKGVVVRKELLYILGAFLVIVFSLSKFGGVVELISASGEKASSLWSMLKMPVLVMVYSVALICFLEVWDRWVDSRRSGNKGTVLDKKTGSVALILCLSVLFTWLLFVTGVLEKTKDAIILALSGRRYSIPFETMVERAKASSCWIALLVVFICIALFFKDNLHVLLAKFRRNKDKKEIAEMVEAVEPVQESEPAESLPVQVWGNAQTDAGGLSFVVPSNAKRLSSGSGSSVMVMDSDKAVYTFSELPQGKVPKGNLTVALYGEPVAGSNSKFKSYHDLLDSLRNSIRGHQNYRWTQSKITEKGVTWDVMYGINPSNGGESAKWDYLFACCDFGDKTFGYIGASGELSSNLGDGEVYEFFCHLIRGVQKRM